MRSVVAIFTLVMFMYLGIQTDEFGRSLGVSLALAALLSMVKGLIASSLTVLIAYALAYLAYLLESRLTEIISSAISNSVDSIPPVLWVLVVVSVSPEPRTVIALVVFIFLSIPTLFRLVHGEVKRISNLGYVQASGAIGTSKMIRFTRHIVPNSFPLVIPALVSLTGNAIAIDGAIGLLGLGNRSDLNLGTFLIRGREQIFSLPMLLISTIIVYSILFYLFSRLRKKFS